MPVKATSDSSIIVLLHSSHFIFDLCLAVEPFNFFYLEVLFYNDYTATIAVWQLLWVLISFD